MLSKSGILFEELAYVVLALAEPIAFVAVPGSGFFYKIVLDAELDEFAFKRHAFIVKDIEMRLLERGCDLIFHNFDTSLVSDHFIASLDRSSAPDIEA